jgi:hypothetical protein
MDHVQNTALLLLNSCVLWAVPSNGLCLQSHSLAMGLYTTILCRSCVIIFNGPQGKTQEHSCQMLGWTDFQTL